MTNNEKALRLLHKYRARDKRLIKEGMRNVMDKFSKMYGYNINLTTKQQTL